MLDWRMKSSTLNIYEPVPLQPTHKDKYARLHDSIDVKQLSCTILEV